MSLLIVIPTNFTSDLHICGRCKTQFTSINDFLTHRLLGNCISTLDDVRDGSDKTQRNLVVTTVPCYDSKENSVIVSNENSKCMEEAYKPLGQNDTKKTQFQTREKLITDEEDAAALLANQLTKQEVEVHFESNEPEIKPQLPDIAEETQEEKVGQSQNDEIKGFHRGKIRNVFRCAVEGCTYKSYMKKDVDRHATVHTGERPYTCLTCGKTFTRSDKLLIHQRIHSGDKRYKCFRCPYAAIDGGSLIKHLRVHNGERPFRCMLCPYRSRDSSQLTVHMRSHTGDAPFVCIYEKCRSAFKTNSDLKRHMAVHSTVKPHVCQLCPYKSTLKANLQLHMQNHHPDGTLKDYKCVQCSDIFQTPRKLKNHLKKKHSDQIMIKSEPSEVPRYEKKRRKTKSKGDSVGNLAKGFNCSQCDSSFVCLNSLQTHERYHRRTKGKSEASLRNELKNDLSFYKQLESINNSVVERNEDSIILTVNPLVEKQDVGNGLLGSETYIVENIALDENGRIFTSGFSNTTVQDFAELVQP